MRIALRPLDLLRPSPDYSNGPMPLRGHYISLQKRLHLTIASSLAALVLMLMLFSRSAQVSHLETKGLRILDQLWMSRTAATRADFYEWRTVSHFHPVKQATANKDMSELCDAFPKAKLREIQPILKTGSGLETRLRPHLQSVSACLGDELLIFSDEARVFDAHTIIDALSALRPGFVRGNSQLESYNARDTSATNDTLLSSSDSHPRGWQSDKFKFLPQVSSTWRMRPHKRWYVFYEDDTYIVWDNMIRFLENFDPDLPWYFGSPSPGARGLWMANGGPGYVISREAMRRLVREDYDSQGLYAGSFLSQRWEEEMMRDCCGDSILSLALHQDAQTNLSGMFPMFQPHGLHSIPLSDEYWCQPLLTMHKTSAEHMLAFRKWEESRRRLHRPLLFADIVDFLNLTTVHIRSDWTNSDFGGYRAPNDGAHISFQSCDLACRIDRDCLQWTYRLGVCTFVAFLRLGHSTPQGGDYSGPETDDTLRPLHKDKNSWAGWDRDGIKQWMSEEGRDCGHVRWEKPSTSRIY